MAVARRDLFRLGRKTSDGRPPWALAEDVFLIRCDRCHQCVLACPKHLLRSGDGGFPVISFARGGCDFCGDCAAACKGGALSRRAGVPALRLAAAVSANCLSLGGTSCRVCGEWCDDGAIRFRLLTGGRAQAEVDSERCTGCGACVARCPVGAVAMASRPQGGVVKCA